jgi:nucleoside-diphosphate-sugar epimerase
VIKNIVTGATGFLGGELARELQKRGEKVVGVGRNIIKGNLLNDAGIEFLELDLTDKNRVLNLLGDCDYIFHCSALSSDFGQYTSFYNANVVATQNVVSTCFKHKVKRLIYVSTPSVYSDTKHHLGLTEESPFASPLNYYTKTKQKAEKLIDEAYKRGLDVVTIRPRAIVGKHEDKILSRLIHTNKRGIPFIDGGIAKIDLTSIENVVYALILARDKGNPGEHYNITNGEPYSFAEIVELFFDKAGITLNKKEIGFYQAYCLAYGMEVIGKLKGMDEIPLTRYSVCSIGRSQTFDLTKARLELGYEPIKSIKTTLAEMANAFR